MPEQSHNLAPMTHDGKIVPPDWDFFVAAPDRIGPLISGETTLRRNEQPMSTRSYSLWVLGVSSMFGVVMAILDRNSLSTFVTYTLVALPFAAFAFLSNTFEHECSYVGENGVARYRIRNSRDGRVRGMELLFANATVCYSEERVGAWDEFRRIEWRGPNGKRIASFESARAFLDRTRCSQQFARFTRAAEHAWTLHLQKTLLTVFQNNGAVLFPMQHKDFIEVSTDRMVIARNPKRLELNSGDIKSVSLSSGYFRIMTSEAGFITMRGHLLIPCHELGNASVFLVVVSHYLRLEINAPRPISKYPDDVL